MKSPIFSAAVQRLKNAVKCGACWWSGHNFNGPLGSRIEEYRCECGTEFTYEAAVWEGTRKNIVRWCHNRFGKCRDCKKRFGDHSGCVPF